MRALREPWRVAVLLSGTLVLLTYALPAMHRLSGGYFSTLQYLGQVEGGGKTEFLIGFLLGLLALGTAATGHARGRVTALFLIGLAGVGLAVHVPSFGGLGGMPRLVNWPQIIAAIAAGLLVGTSKQTARPRALLALGLATAGLVLACFVRGAQMVPTELGWVATQAHDASLARGVDARRARAWPRGGARAVLRGRAGRPLGGRVRHLHRFAALARSPTPAVVTISAPIVACWLVAAAPGSPAAWDLMVRLRVTLVWLGLLTWLTVGLRALALPERHAALLPDASPIAE